jgi:hypothetical protein
MPNWTTNRILIEGREPDLRAFLDAVRSQDQIFDFNRIIPMPELLRHTGCGNITIDGIKVGSWYVSRGTPPECAEAPRRFTPDEEAALQEIGFTNWYDWSCANWGTKWNACDPQISESPGRIEISFDTAWDAPEPIFERLVELFPLLIFRFEWRHEGEWGCSSLDSAEIPSSGGDQ